MSEGKRVMKAEIAVESKEAESRRHKQTAQNAETDGVDAKVMLAEVFIEERQKQQNTG